MTPERVVAILEIIAICIFVVLIVGAIVYRLFRKGIDDLLFRLRCSKRALLAKKRMASRAKKKPGDDTEWTSLQTMAEKNAGKPPVS